MGAILEARGRGAACSDATPTGPCSPCVPGLYFANGVTVTADESALVFAETQGRRVSKYWLTGPQASSVTPLADESARLSRTTSPPGPTAGAGSRWRPPINAIAEWLAPRAPDPTQGGVATAGPALPRGRSQRCGPWRWTPTAARPSQCVHTGPLLRHRHRFGRAGGRPGVDGCIGAPAVATSTVTLSHVEMRWRRRSSGGRWTQLSERRSRPHCSNFSQHPYTARLPENSGRPIPYPAQTMANLESASRRLAVLGSWRSRCWCARPACPWRSAEPNAAPDTNNCPYRLSHAAGGGLVGSPGRR